MIADIPWLVGGDFNMVLDISEVCGQSGDIRSATEDFQACLHDTGLINLSMQGEWFTWHNCSSDTQSLWKKLDRILVNDSWLGTWPNSFYASLNAHTSDHSPLVLRGNVPFQTVITRKLKALKPIFRAQRQKKGDLLTNVRLAATFLDTAQSLLARDRLCPLLLHLDFCCKLILRLASKFEQHMLQQWAKVAWMKGGDQCSWIFFCKVAKRRASKRIFQITNTLGQILTDQQDVINEFIAFYQALLGGERRVRLIDLCYLRPWAWHIINEVVEEEIYMDQPEGFTSVGEEQKVSGSSVAFLVLYVDDILLIGNDVKMLGDTKVWLSTQFSMKDLGEASYILGIKIIRDRSKRMLGMTQTSYVEKVLKRFKMENSKRGFLPVRHGVKLSKKQSPKTDEELRKMFDIPYASAVGSIQYVVQCTRPDVAFALSVTSRYQACAGEAHWTAVKTILKYLRRTKDMFLVYGGGELILEGYSDASFQSDEDDSKSQSGFVFKLNGGVVAWKSSKQDTTADSITEAEYIAASEAAKEAVWMKNYIQELGVVPSIAEPVVIFCDNNGAIAQAKEPRSHHRSKHILRRYHLLREMVGRGDVRMDRVTSPENMADPLTKPCRRLLMLSILGRWV
ncbi:UNVERIFIED_CONTAM: Secreted RxLR effector protein [Sesamum latifolium]|uniref:Secreted RxLR effector protein n=1 Tax=Sesamum latifolium TaxID=2727402 RepID=A0AAW2UHV6_9LAMI